MSSVMRVQQNFLTRTCKEASSKEEIPCEFSAEDDFEVDEAAEGVDEEVVKTVLAEDHHNEMGKRSKKIQVEMQLRRQRVQT